MSLEKIKTIAVIGAGSMGQGIAYLAAQSGRRTILVDVNQEAADKGKAKLDKYVQKSVDKNKMTAEAKEELMGKIEATGSMEKVSEADFIIEAVYEDPNLKKEMFKKFDEYCRPEVVLATNTSSISITSIAAVTKRPGQVIGMHFFNPAQVMKLVELIRGYYTTDETVELAAALAQNFGKTTVEVRKDTPGFIVNRLMFAQLAEAMRLVQEGVASIEDVDKAMQMGLNHPMGPFTLQDFTGVEVCLSVLDYLYTETKQDHFAPPENMKALIRAGRYGRKTNAGWYNYS